MEVSEYTKMDAVEKNHWWFIAKRNYIANVLERYAVTGMSVLDIGCGTGAIMDFVRSKGYTVEGVDMSEDALQYCRKKNLTVHHGVAEKLPLENNSFDVVIASDVLEHITDDVAVVREVARVLKPGGIFIITVPAHQLLFSYHDHALHHVRRYSKEGLRRVLTTAFTVEFISWIHLIILVPAACVRVMQHFLKNNGESDVGPASRMVNLVMRAVYVVELGFFRIFHKLPFGLSLFAVVRKPRV